MVLPCIPCAVAVVPAVGSSVTALLGLGSAGATAYAVRKSLNKKKRNKTKKRKKKKNNISQKGGTIKKDENKIHKDFWKCFMDCYKERDTTFKKPFGISGNDWKKSLSSLEKKQMKELKRKATKCSRNCKNIEKRQMRKHKLKYSKEYKVINKALKDDCCRCHYVKSGKTLRKVKGPFSHCSYDMDNCCKGKKTIVKSKK